MVVKEKDKSKQNDDDDDDDEYEYQYEYQVDLHACSMFAAFLLFLSTTKHIFVRK